MAREAAMLIKTPKVTHIQHDVRIASVEFSVVLLWVGNRLEVLEKEEEEMSGRMIYDFSVIIR